MQKFYAGVAIASVALATSASAAPEKRGKVRRVELISMTTASALPMAEGDGGPADDLPAPDLPPEFKVHDLSRRYVEFRMKQELASIFPEVSVSDSLAPAVAATSSISVPDWMKPGVGSFTAPAFVPGLCSARVSAVRVSLARGRKSAGNLLWHDELDRLRTRHSNGAL